MENDAFQAHGINRRAFLCATGAAVFAAGTRRAQAAAPLFQLNYILASCMYGEMPLAAILPEAAQMGADTIDLWPRKHGNQREQVAEMGHEAFLALLQQHELRLGISTRYDLGPYGLQDEMAVVQALGGNMIVTGSGNVEGDSIKARVAAFIEKLKPHIAAAEEHGVTLAIENHGNQLIESPDSLRYFAELSPSERLGIAFAPYHLPQDPEVLASLLRDIGPKLVHFYAWEHGMGCVDKMPKAREMQQLPGYGQLDFAPIVHALRDIGYTGHTSIFMHPVPRGIPILPTATEVTNAINRSREYLEACVANTA